MFWNLIQLANALAPLVKGTGPFESTLNSFVSNFEERYLTMMLEKVGLFSSADGDELLIGELQQALVQSETDMTIFFRLLADFDPTEFTTASSVAALTEAMYVPEELSGDVLATWNSWFAKYVARLETEGVPKSERSDRVKSVNPKYVLRNYMAQLAIDAADQGDYSLVEELHTLLGDPYGEQPENSKWFAKRPEWARSKAGCSMLSCSS